MTLAVALAVLALSAVDLAAQAVDPSQTSDASTPSGQQQRTADSPFSQQLKRDLVKKQNELREQEIKKDTDKLLELATELKQYVDKTNENIISLDVIRKAEQIEKLAKTVKDKMKAP
jgi:methionyl-tRNA synthetase